MLVHVLPGVVGIASGFTALFAAKGARLHRKSGILFVAAMIVMATSGAVMAALGGAEASVLGGVLATYLMITALTTVRPPTEWSRRLDVGLMPVALAVSLTAAALGFDAIARGGR